MKGFVYLICNPETDTYKIGVTKRSIETRLKELQTGNCSELFVKAFYRTDNPYKIESMLHRHYRQRGKLNEWFALDADDISSFNDICEKYERIIESLSDNAFFV